MKKRIPLLILPIITLILELLPSGAVLNFGNPEGEPFRETFSYFSLTPFGYANFGPLLTAITSCAVFIILLIYCKSGKYSLLNIAKGFLCGGIFFSVLPLAMFGAKYFSSVGAFITASLSLELIVLLFIKKPHEPKTQVEVIK